MRTLLVGLIAATILVAPITTAEAVPPPFPCVNKGGEADFNGDGFDDVAIADSHATVAGHTAAGTVRVRYGGGNGLVGEGWQTLLTQDSPGVLGDVGWSQQFGYAMALGRIDSDRCLDLVVVTTPGGSPNPEGRPLVQVLYGSPNGLGKGKPSLALLSASSSNPGVYATSVDVAPKAGTERAAVAIGMPGIEVNGMVNAGAVRVIGLTSAGDIAATAMVTDATPGVPGVPEDYARFGWAVALGRIDGDPERYDLVATAPDRDTATVPEGGAVTVVNDVLVQALAYTGTVWDQDSPGVSGVLGGEQLDFLQSGTHGALAVGRLGDGVQLFSSAGSGLVPGIRLTQDTPGVEGVVESGERFGWSVALAPGLLAVGTPRDTVGTNDDAGTVQVFPLDNPAADVMYSQDSPGVPGIAGNGEQFGRTVAFAGGTNESALLVRVSNGDGGAVDVIPMDGGAPRIWIPSGPGAYRFGEVLAGRAS